MEFVSLLSACGVTMTVTEASARNRRSVPSSAGRIQSATLSATRMLRMCDRSG